MGYTEMGSWVTAWDFHFSALDDPTSHYSSKNFKLAEDCFYYNYLMRVLFSEELFQSLITPFTFLFKHICHTKTLSGRSNNDVK